MAMIKCTECGKDMSDKANVCPNCGCPIEEIRTKLGEIESEREKKIRVKEEEKKRKEVEAEAKKQRKEAAKKALTPAEKRKRVVIGVFALILVLSAGVCGWYFGVKIPRENAYQAYILEVQACNDGIQKYNEVISQYNDRAKEVIAANDEFDETIAAAQALVDCGDTPYEGAKITILSNSIKDARNNKVSTPELKELAPSVQTDPGMEKAGRAEIVSATSVMDETLDKYVSDISMVNTEKDALSVPDYSDFIDTLNSNSKELEDSYAIQKQITAPTEEWVMTRLGRVSDVANMAPVTEEHDPNDHLNKAGGYTSTVYFSTALLGTEELSGDPLIDEGTDAGGAVETYRTEDDAQKRCDYLASLDGVSILAPGSHEVLGTMVIRTSNALKASQQETLTNAIIESMISLD